MGETGKVMTVTLRVQDDGSVVLDRATGKVDKFAAASTRAGSAARGAASSHAVYWSETDKLKDAIDRVNAAEAARATAMQRTNSLFGFFKHSTTDASAATSDFGKALQTNVGWLTTYASAAAAAGSALGLYLVKRGLEQNSIMQQSRLGMAALVSGLGEITDQNDKVLQGQDRWNASLQISEKLQERLKIAALATSANYKDLVQVMQEGLGPMLGAGIADPTKIVNFVQAIAQTGGALGIPGDRLGQEIRALIQGEKGPDNQLANALLGDTTKQQVEQMKQQLTYYDFLMKKMSSFQKAGEEASNTLAGSLSNLQDAIDQALGEGTSGEVEGVTKAILALTNEIVSFDDAGKAVFNPDFIKGVTELAKAFVFLAEAAVMIAEDIPATVEALQNLSGKALLRAAWQSATGQVVTGTDIEEILDKVKRESVGPGKEVLDIAARNEGKSFLEDKRKGLTFPQFTTTMDRGGVEQELGYFSEKNHFTTDRGANQRMHDILAAYVTDGKLTIQEMREAERKFDEEAAAIAKNTGPKLKGKPIKPQPTEEQQRSIDELRRSWKRDISTFHRDLDAAGDPVATELAKIADVRQQKLDELAKQKAALGKFMSADEFTKREKDIESVWGATGEASAIARDNPQKTKQTKIDTQRAIEDARLDVIRDSIERELQMTLAKDQREFEDAKKGLDASSKEYQALADKKAALDKVAADRAQLQRGDKVRDIGTDVQRTIEDARLDVIHDAIERELQMALAKNQREFEDASKYLSASGLEYTALAVKKNALDQLALDHANKARDEDLKATTAWAKKTAEMIADSYEKVPQLVRDAALASRQALTGETETFFTDLMSHNVDLAKELGDLSQTLGKSWAHIFAQILTNGGSVTGQLKTMFDGLRKAGGNPMTDSGSLLDAGVQGAGFGSFIGGAFGGPNNQAALGGTAGGAIGAIIGSIFPGIGTVVGTVVGAALGTAIGSVIQKGTDSIKVAMSGVSIDSLRGKSNHVYLPNESTDLFAGGGSIDVTEKGISPQAREDLLVQIRRKTKETLKSWQDIIDLLPQDLKDQMASMPPPKFNLSGGVEEGDIRDENALTSLQDFLGEKMPKAVYGAYHEAIAKAMSLMGVQYGRAQEMFAEWGTLTGQELHDAVQRFFKAVLEANDWKGKIGGSLVEDANKALNQTEAGKLRDINAQIGLGVASMSKLTDVDDIIAAQEHLNELSRQYYDESLAATEQLIAEQKQLHDANQSLQEQVQLAGMGDQQKMDYYYGQLTNLREDLKRATDPKDIAAIEQKMNSYVQSALGLAPDNKENRDKLLGILKDIEAVRDSRIAVAQQEIVDQNQKAATMLQQAATALLGAADALKPPSTNPNPGGGDGGDKNPGPNDPEPLPPLYATADVNAFGSALRAATEDLRHLHDWATAGGDGQMVAYVPQTGPSRTGGGADEESWQSAARAIRDALDGFEIGGSMQVAVDVNADGLVDAAARQAVQTVKIQFQRNPDSFRSRTGGRR